MKHGKRGRDAGRGAPAGDAGPAVGRVAVRPRAGDAVPNRRAVYGVGGFFLFVLVFALLWGREAPVGAMIGL